MRQVTLMNLAASQLGARNCNTSNYMSAGCITSPAKSLDILRKNIQSAINKDIDNVIRKYLEVCTVILMLINIDMHFFVIEILPTSCK